MTEPKRWTIYEHAGGRMFSTEQRDPWKKGIVVVSLADFDRLRDERDRLLAERERWRGHADKLAEALGEAMGNMDAGFSDTQIVAKACRVVLKSYAAFAREGDTT